MKKLNLLLLILFCFQAYVYAQEILPGISVRNSNDKIIVSWKNEYQLPVTTINIQRSYDSLKNYTTIGSVLNPQNKENGYADAHAPYNKMYYRVFIAFDGGAYLISQPVRPVKDTGAFLNSSERFPWQTDPNNDPTLQVPPAGTETTGLNAASKWIFTSKDNNVVIFLPGAANKKYTAIFFDELEKKIFELSNLKEEYLIIEKVNFIRAGWYRFELFESGKLVDKNKFYIPKDGKITNDPVKKPGR